MAWHATSPSGRPPSRGGEGIAEAARPAAHGPRDDEAARQAAHEIRARHPGQPLADALGNVVARLPVHPNVITVAALFVAGGGAFLLATQRYVSAALVMLMAASLDFIDGAVARRRGLVSRAGGYLDSLIDRYIDFLVLFGIMIGTGDQTMWIVGSVAVFGVLMTSGAKWRVHESAPIPRGAWHRDLFERPERYIVLLPGIMAHGIAMHLGHPLPILFVTVVVTAILANLTVIQRMRKAMRLLGKVDRDHPL